METKENFKIDYNKMGADLLQEMRENPVNYHFNEDGNWRFTTDKEKIQILEKLLSDTKWELENAYSENATLRNQLEDMEDWQH